MTRPLLYFTLFTAAFGIGAPALWGLTVPGYSGFRQYISELGAVGAPGAALVNYGIFLPTAVLCCVAVVWLFLTVPAPHRYWTLLLLSVSAGNLGAALLPCDAGCPAQGSPQQALHNLLGLVQYACGGIALLGLRRFAPAASYLGALALLCLFLMGGPGADWRGLLQRIAELSLFGSFPYLAWTAAQRNVSDPVKRAFN